MLIKPSIIQLHKDPVLDISVELKSQEENPEIGNFLDSLFEAISSDYVDGLNSIFAAFSSLKYVNSKSECRRMCENKQITINNERIETDKFLLKRGNSFEIIIGGKNKKYVKLTIPDTISLNIS